MLFRSVYFNICAIERSNVFHQPPFCDPNIISSSDRLDRYHIKKACDAETFQDIPQINELCESRPITAIKVIKMRRLEHIADLLREDPEFRVIYLVRDPRALVSSRFDIPQNKWDLKNKAEMKDVCSRYWVWVTYNFLICRHIILFNFFNHRQI